MDPSFEPARVGRRVGARRGRRATALALALMMLVLVLFVGGARSDIPGITLRASVASSDDEGDAASMEPALSASGLQIAFLSDATNLVADDANETTDLFVRDAAAGTTVRVSVDSKGEEADSAVQNPAISADGRFVVFDTDASTLGGGGETFHVHLRDRDRDADAIFDEAGGVATIVVSRNSQGDLGDNNSEDPDISADGRFIAFRSQASNLAANAGSPTFDIFVRDRDLDGDGIFDQVDRVRTRLLSRRAFGGNGGANGDGDTPAISSDGRYVAFASLATDLVGRDEDDDGFCDGACDGNEDQDIYVADVVTGDISVVSRRQGGSFTNCPGSDLACNADPTISADGRYVAFSSADDNIVGSDNNGFRDIFVRDRDADRDGIFDEPNATATFLASLETDGDPANGESLKPSMSADGRYVAFESDARDLIKDNPREVDTNGARDVFVRDVVAGTTNRVSVDSSGDETFPGTSSENASISSSGRFVAFDSDDERLVGALADNNEVRDVFARNRLPLITIEPVPIMFGARTLRTVSDAEPLTIANEGSGPLDVARVHLVGGAPDDFLVGTDTCSSRRLHAEDECLVAVRFRPTLPGPRTALLAFEFNDRDIPDQSVLLIGSGNTPVLSINPGLGRPGAVAFVTGVDFPASTKIAIRWEPGIGRTEIRADALGNLALNMLVMHNDTIGPRELVAKGGGVRVTIPFLVVPGSAQPGAFVDRR